MLYVVYGALLCYTPYTVDLYGWTIEYEIITCNVKVNTWTIFVNENVRNYGYSNKTM